MKSMKIDVAVPEPAVCADCENFTLDYTHLYADGKHTYTSYKCTYADICEDIMDRMRQLFNDQQFRGGF